MVESSRNRSSGLVFAILSALAFGGSGPAARPLLDAGLDPMQVTWLRVAGAALLLLPVALYHHRALRTRPALLLAYGMFPMAGVQAFYFAAISRIPVGVALLIEFLGPVLVLLWTRTGYSAERPIRCTITTFRGDLNRMTYEIGDLSARNENA